MTAPTIAPAAWFLSLENLADLYDWMTDRGHPPDDPAYYLRKPWKWGAEWQSMMAERQGWAAPTSDLTRHRMGATDTLEAEFDHEVMFAACVKGDIDHDAVDKAAQDITARLDATLVRVKVYPEPTA